MISIIICVIAAILLILLLVALVMLAITVNVESASAEEFNKKMIKLGAFGYSNVFGYNNSWTGYCGEMGPTNYFGILT